MAAKKKKKIFGVIGFPVRHSLSPIMHNAVFKELGINAQYRAFEVKPARLKDFMRGLRKNGIFGLNVTIPHKEAVVPLLSEIRESPGFARSIGAVNTVKMEENKPCGYNTDGVGFIRALNCLGFEFEGKKVALLGAGGAAKAVAYNIAENKAAISIYDLNRQRCRELVNKLKTKFSRRIKFAERIDDLNIADCDMLVNATPVGMQDEHLPVPADYLHKKLYVYDLVYNPKGRRTTKLVEEARKKGLKAHAGIWMLVFQGAISAKIWFPEIDEKEVASIMFDALRKQGFFVR
jgi:shikimate dehydrogenase